MFFFCSCSISQQLKGMRTKLLTLVMASFLNVLIDEYSIGIRQITLNYYYWSGVGLAKSKLDFDFEKRHSHRSKTMFTSVVFAIFSVIGTTENTFNPFLCDVSVVIASSACKRAFN